MKKIFATEYRHKAAEVWYDPDWHDHIVRYWYDGAHMAQADSHHYNDKDDAVSTAKYYVAQP